LDATIVEQHNVSGDDNTGRLIWADNLENPPSGLGKEQAELAYFVGCVGSFFPRSYDVPRSLVQILERSEVDYALMGGLEWCCGYPQFINGELELAQDAIRHNVEQVRNLGAQRVVFSCPSCYHIWTHVYPELLDEALGLEMLHSTQLLERLIQEGRIELGPLDLQITYHDPCDLGRKSEVFAAPRNVLEQIPGVTLIEMQENCADSHCCGGGGNLESHDADLAQRIAARRVRQAAETGAQVIVSACQQCERTLSNAARAERIRMRVMDVSQIVLRAMDAAT
jgi:heterodisulfide reductase subunit D